MDYEKRLTELFIELPEVTHQAKYFTPTVQAGKLLFVSGLLPFAEGKLAFKGRLGLEITLDQGVQASRYAMIQCLSAVQAKLGSLNKIEKIVQITGFVASGGDFKDHDRVLDGASNLLQEIFGTAGKHSRMAAGVNTLPSGACVELGMIVEVK